MSKQEFQVGDKVTVQLPGGKCTGTVKAIINNFNWTGDVAYEVEGDAPFPFITIARNLTEAEA